MHNLKAENYVLVGGHTEDFSPGDRLSGCSGKGGARICGVFAKTNQVALRAPACVPRYRKEAVKIEAYYSVNPKKGCKH